MADIVSTLNKESCGFFHTPEYCEDFHAGVKTVYSQRLLSLISFKINLFKFKVYDGIWNFSINLQSIFCLSYEVYHILP